MDSSDVVHFQSLAKLVPNHENSTSYDHGRIPKCLVILSEYAAYILPAYSLVTERLKPLSPLQSEWWRLDCKQETRA